MSGEEESFDVALIFTDVDHLDGTHVLLGAGRAYAAGANHKVVSSLLVLVLDTNPVWWGKAASADTGVLSLAECLDNIMVLANAHLSLSHHNQLAILAAHNNQSKFLFPAPEGTAVEVDRSGSIDGKYEKFDEMNKVVMHQAKDLLCQSFESELYQDSNIAGALLMGLCYIHRISKETPIGITVSSRILVVKGSEDNPSQYMNFMNAVFTAQKQNVVMDACILDNDSGLLQQAADITGGIYLNIPQRNCLLQYLMWLYLPDPLLRPELVLPPKVQVDYRAACFCHRTLIDVGYVCSVCLSIFCNFSPICATCQTTFKLMGPPKLMKKKSKKAQ